MPIKLNEFEFGYTGGEADFESSSDFINELEFYSTSTDPSDTSVAVDTSGSSVMGSTSAALMLPTSDSWCKVENMDEETLLSMSPPDPFNYSNWDDVIISDISLRTVSDYSSNDNSDVLLTHDCMWGGSCLNCEQEFRTLSRQHSTSCSSNSSSISSSDNVCISNTTKGYCSSSSNNSSSSCNNNNNSNSNMIDNNLRTGSSSILIQQSQNNNNTSCSNNNNSSSISNNTGSANSSNNLTANNNTKSCVVKTIEVPSVSGPGGIVKTGVIVQKTVQKSLLINKAKTKIENNTVNNKNTNSNNHTNDNILVKAKTINDCHSYVNFNSNNRNSLVQTLSPPITNSRPETPMSLSESEDDSDFYLSSVFLNIDNLKPPQGDLWDEVLAAVEQEQASGIEIPPLIENDKNNQKLNSILSIKDELISIKDEPISIKDEPILIKDEPITSIKDEPIDFDEDDYSPMKCVQSSPVRLAKSPNVVNSSPPSSLPNNIIAAATTVVSDHSYDKRAWIRLEDLGVQTPSDSEEEIDVVSLIERSRASSRSSSASSRSGSSTSSGGLPTNPSAEEQEEIQVLTTSKLLNAASRAVSRRLRSKITGRTKVSPCKRRSSESDEYQSTTRLPKKPRSCYKSKSRFAADSESDSKEKRDMHNNMERIRRIELRNAFEELKVHVPALLVRERAPKVQILQEAASYCTELKRRSRELTSQVSLLRQEQSKLLKTVSELRRSQFLATKRCSQT